MDKTSPYYNCIRPDESLVDPVFDWARKENIKFECTEKIDGTNMSIYIIPQRLYTLDGEPNGIYDYTIEVHGKTIKANLNQNLVNNILTKWPKEMLVDVFTVNGNIPTEPIILYGEGYGAGIQKGGNYIKNDVDFILFDIRIGNFWLERDSIEDIASKLQMKVVSIIGYYSINEAIEYVKKGFKSTIAENKDYDAEGLVLKFPFGLLKRNCDRIMTKIKTCDFRALENAEMRKALLEKKLAEKKINDSI